MGIKCCYKCKDRKYKCHSFCGRYLSELAEEKKKKDLIEKSKQSDRLYYEYKCKIPSVRYED